MFLFLMWADCGLDRLNCTTTLTGNVSVPTEDGLSLSLEIMMYVRPLPYYMDCQRIYFCLSVELKPWGLADHIRLLKKEGFSFLRFFFSHNLLTRAMCHVFILLPLIILEDL